MAQISFFMSERETYSLVQFFIDQFDAKFTPEKNWTRNFPTFSNIADIKKREEVSGYKRYFITSKKWENHPFTFGEVNAKDHHSFYVRQSYGGPAFDLMFPRTIEENGVKWIAPGMLSDYASYFIDESSGTLFKRPIPMADAYKKLCRFIKKGSYTSFCEEENFKGPLITPEAFQEYQKGTWLRIGDNHFKPIKK
jgi:hypothetical protein